MAILVYAEQSEGKFPKSVLESVFYAGKLAEQTGTEAVAIAIGQNEDAALASLGSYGISKVISVNNEKIDHFDSLVFTNVIAQAVELVNADIIVFSNNYSSKAVAPRLAARLKAGLVVGVMDFPSIEGSNFSIKRSAFSGKAFAEYVIKSERKILTLQPNSFSPESTDDTATIELMEIKLEDADFKIKVKEVNKITDKVPLTEAAIIVSGGRGLKGPENWGMIEELADLLNAATACSKPVADMDWRPHGEHVGQTGITVRPNLYIAIGISGAIQHLAGVNGSRVMVAINKDPDAPFFKVADYGIVGDAFEVVPKLIESLKTFKNN